MNPTRLALICAVMLALAGCASQKKAGTAGPAKADQVEGTAESGTELEQLLRYFHRVRGLSGTELGWEQDDARHAYILRPSDFQRVRLALALLMPGAGAGDQVLALELLDPVAKNPQSGLRELAFLINAYLQDQRRLENSVDDLQQKLDSAKALEKVLRERDQTIQAMQQKLDALKSLEEKVSSAKALEKTLFERDQAIQALQQKLDALKSMEKALLERAQAGAKR